MPNISGAFYSLSSRLGNVNATLSAMTGQPQILANRVMTRAFMGMPAVGVIAISILKPKIAEILKALGKRKEIQLWRVFNAVAESAIIFTTKAQQKAPKHTGALVNSIVPAAGYERFNSSIYKGQAICRVPYAIYVEQGTKRWHKKIYPKTAKALVFMPVVAQRIGFRKIEKGKRAGQVAVTKGQKHYAGDSGIGAGSGPIFRKWVSGQTAQPFMRKAFNAAKKQVFNKVIKAAKPRTVEKGIAGKVPAFPIITPVRHKLTQTGRLIRNINPWVNLSVSGAASRYGRRWWTRKFVSKLVVRRSRGR